ncbi:hypothetical protein [Roseateles sp.]|uniref:hypothetical protein n=1 Tax=Roseateles sp. TaxID=1971397 RepID=UPI0031D41351
MKRAVIASLQCGDYEHEARADLDVKNLLATGAVSADFVVDVIKASCGADYECSPLHANGRITCHLIKARGWYVKFYFVDPATMFISVHR